MSGPESRIEAHLGRRCRALGGQSIKLSPTVAGVPDRMVLLPGGHLYLVELKSRTGRLRPAQRVWHDRAKMLGTRPVVLRSMAEVDDWLQSLGIEPM